MFYISYDDDLYRLFQLWFRMVFYDGLFWSVRPMGPVKNPKVGDFLAFLYFAPLMYQLLFDQYRRRDQQRPENRARAWRMEQSRSSCGSETRNSGSHMILSLNNKCNGVLKKERLFCALKLKSSKFKTWQEHLLTCKITIHFEAIYHNVLENTYIVYLICQNNIQH